MLPAIFFPFSRRSQCILPHPGAAEDVAVRSPCPKVLHLFLKACLLFLEVDLRFLLVRAFTLTAAGSGSTVLLSAHDAGRKDFSVGREGLHGGRAGSDSGTWSGALYGARGISRQVLEGGGVANGVIVAVAVSCGAKGLCGAVSRAHHKGGHATRPRVLQMLNPSDA